MKKKKIFIILILLILLILGVFIIFLISKNVSKMQKEIKKETVKENSPKPKPKEERENKKEEKPLSKPEESLSKEKPIPKENKVNTVNLNNYHGKAYMIIDRKYDKVLLKRNEHMQISPASLTKLYLIAYVNTFCSLDEEVLVTREVLNTVKKGSSLAYLKLKKYSVRNLYEALLLPSGNDAAYVLATYAGSKLNKEAKTVAEKKAALLRGLNEYLKANHYNDTVIYDPSGFDLNTKTSAYDLKKISDHLLKIDLFRYLTSQDDYRATLPDGTFQYWKTANEFIDKKSKHYHPNVSGTKTGSIKGAYNIVTLYNKYHKEFLVISLGSSSEDTRYVDTRVLLSIIDNHKELAK